MSLNKLVMNRYEYMVLGDVTHDNWLEIRFAIVPSNFNNKVPQ